MKTFKSFYFGIKIFTAIIIFFVIPSICFGALAVDSQEAAGAGHRGTASGVAVTWPFNNVGGNLLVCSIVSTNTTGNTPTLSTPTYNGVAMTLAGSQLQWDTSSSVTAIYYLANPATGSNTVSMTGTGTTNFAILGGCMSFSGANTSSPIGTPTTGKGDITAGTTATAGSITAASGNYIFASGGWGSAGGAAGAGFTRTFLANGGGTTAGDDILGEYALSSGAPITPTFTWTGADFWAIIAVEIKAAASAAAPSSVVKVRGKVKIRGKSKFR